MPRGERRKRLSDKSRAASFHSFRFQGAQFTGRCFGGGPGRTRPSFIRLVHEADCRMDTPDEPDVRRSLFMLPMFSSGCAYFRTGFPRGAGEERSFAMGSVPFCSNGRSAAPAATVAPGEARTPPHGGGKNDRHKRRGCLTRCRRPFFIRTAFRELFRIRNFRRVKKTC